MTRAAAAPRAALLMAAADSPDARWVTAALSGDAIAAEYRVVISALARCTPADATFGAALYPPEVVAAARRWWTAMMRSEYESSSVFTDLALQLREIDAPLDVQAVTLRMAQDELRHTELCARVVEVMGGTARISAPAVQRPARHPDCSMDETVLRNVIYGCCLGETVNAARLAKRMAEVSDPFVHETFRQLLADERLHAQFGFFYLETRAAWMAAHPEVARSLARYLRYAFARLEQYMGANPAGARGLTAAERAVGLPDLTDMSATFQETMLNACIPGLERFGIAAAAAWAARSAAGQPGAAGTPAPPLTSPPS